MPDIDAVLIAGPTASGKSQLALGLAEALGGTIVNADSMQVYRELRILTARPSDAETARAPHLLYGHVSAREHYSVGRYQNDAIAALEKVRAAKRIPIFTGGTGLYFAALTDGLSNIPPVPASVRAAAAARLEAIGQDAFHGELGMRDPQSAGRLRASDRQRMLRAYEVFEATGRALSSWQGEAGRPVLAGLTLAKFVLDVPRPLLRERIETRFRAMLADGARDEAASLEGLDPTLPSAKTLGLRELWALRSGAMEEAEAVTLVVTATRQFAKRQMTWFRHRMADWHWIGAADQSKIITETLKYIA